MKFTIHYRDREFAREAGDPILGVFDADTKEQAEAMAHRSGINSYGAGLWAWPLILNTEKEKAMSA